MAKLDQYATVRAKLCFGVLVCASLFLTSMRILVAKQNKLTGVQEIIKHLPSFFSTNIQQVANFCLLKDAYLHCAIFVKC